MLNRMTAKRVVRKTMGWLQSFQRLVSREDYSENVCIFYYHRIAETGFIDPQIDDRSVSPAMFEQQIAFLSEFAEIIPLEKIRESLQRKDRHPQKPLVCLTFDDGYVNFQTRALPVLERYGAPATVFVITDYIGSRQPPAFDRWAQRNIRRVSPDAWRLMNWRELEKCAASELVTIGSHSHRHLRGSACSADEISAEVRISAEILRRRVGARHARIYAYPFGNSNLGDVTEIYEQAVRSAGFSLAVTTDAGLVSPAVNIFRLPRLEVHSLDTINTLRAKAAGAILPLYIKDAFHKMAARGRKPGAKTGDAVLQDIFG